MIPDVIVVGAGPAGSAASYLLAKSGFDVILLDKSKFPRDKICGDGIGLGSVKILDKMGLISKFRGYHKIRGALIFLPNGSHLRTYAPKIPGIPNHGFVIPRLEFDSILKDHALDSGVEFREGAHVLDPILEQGRTMGVRFREGGNIKELRSRLVIAADGANSRLAQSLGIRIGSPEHTSIGIRAYYSNVNDLEPEFFHLFLDPNLAIFGYGWIFPLSEDRANVGFGILISELNRRKVGLRKLFHRFISRNPAASKILSGSKQESKLGAWRIPMGSLPGPRYSDGILFIGDAASFVDPLSGEGIHYALRSAEMASQVGIKALAQQDTSAGILSEYESLWRAELGRVFLEGYKLRNRLLGSKLMRMLFYRALSRESKHQQIADGIFGAMSGLLPRRIPWRLVPEAIF